MSMPEAEETGTHECAVLTVETHHVSDRAECDQIKVRGWMAAVECGDQLVADRHSGKLFVRITITGDMRIDDNPARLFPWCRTMVIGDDDLHPQRASEIRLGA